MSDFKRVFAVDDPAMQGAHWWQESVDSQAGLTRRTTMIALGVGAQGLGGLSTILDVKIMDYPTHAASKPVAMIPNCAATRHAHFTLDGSGRFTYINPRIKALLGYDRSALVKRPFTTLVMPEDLDRIDTDAIRACSQLLSNIIARSKRLPLPTFEQPKHLTNRLTFKDPPA